MKQLHTSMFYGLFAALMMSSTMGQQTFASEVKSVMEGEQLAREWCSRCHNIDPGAPFKQFPPSFSSISVYRSSDQIHARITVPPLHSNMPNVASILTPDNIANLVDYIVSLEGR